MRRRKIEKDAQTPLAPVLNQGPVDSLQRGLEILRLFDGSQTFLNPTEIANRLGLPRPTVAKLIGTLESFNFLRASAAGTTYEPHAACLALGHAAKQGLDVVQAALPGMWALAERFGVHVCLTMRDRLHMLVLEHCVPTGQMTLGLSTGAQLPLAASASGRAYLWAQKPGLQAELIDLLKESGQDSVYRFMPGVYAAFQELESSGCCFVASPVTRQSNSIATPLYHRGAPSYVLAAMSVGAMDDERKLREEVGPELRTTAARITRDLDSLDPF